MLRSTQQSKKGTTHLLMSFAYFNLTDSIQSRGLGWRDRSLFFLKNAFKPCQVLEPSFSSTTALSPGPEPEPSLNLPLGLELFYATNPLVAGLGPNQETAVSQKPASVQQTLNSVRVETLAAVDAQTAGFRRTFLRTAMAVMGTSKALCLSYWLRVEGRFVK
ncbi:MAG: hypothetical protein ACFE0I_11945 [Elainellaceae cyanobacterium]